MSDNSEYKLFGFLRKFLFHVLSEGFSFVYPDPIYPAQQRTYAALTCCWRPYPISMFTYKTALSSQRPQSASDCVALKLLESIGCGTKRIKGLAFNLSHQKEKSKMLVSMCLLCGVGEGQSCLFLDTIYYLLLASSTLYILFHFIFTSTFNFRDFKILFFMYWQKIYLNTLLCSYLLWTSVNYSPCVHKADNLEESEKGLHWVTYEKDILVVGSRKTLRIHKYGSLGKK